MMRRGRSRTGCSGEANSSTSPGSAHAGAGASGGAGAGVSVGASVDAWAMGSGEPPFGDSRAGRAHAATPAKKTAPTNPAAHHRLPTRQEDINSDQRRARVLRGIVPLFERLENDD